jgi:site-specific DNA-methyltransferase (adenine-specific)
MKEFPDKFFELAIVDPPYGASDAVETNKSLSKNKAAHRNIYTQFENTKPNIEYFCELNRVSKNTIIWGGNYFGCAGGVIVWNKYGTAFGEGEIAICSTHKSVRIFEYVWNGMIQDNMKDKEDRIHPTQKPVALYKWLLKNYAKEGDKILDTHLGSGSSRIAAFDGGFEFWGYELDKDYFDASVKRFNQHKSQLKLFPA